MELADGKILAEIVNGIGTITFNQPAKHNAISVDMWTGMGDALDQFSADPAVRVVVLTGAGDKAFVSGADISQFEKQRNSADTQAEYDRQTSIGRRKLENFGKPVIARIKGFCLGGGLAIAMNTDIRIASDDSQLGIPAARLGVAYHGEAVRRLVGLVGPAHARWILYSGLRMPGAEAERIGLVNRCVPADRLDEEVSSLAATLAENAPLTIAAAKFAVAEALRDPDQRDQGQMDELVAACFNSADFKEGRTAFMEKRRPRFQGV